MTAQSHGKSALLVFALATSVLWFFAADRLRLNIDEGIYLDGALRSYKGETIYRDYLAHTGPGTFWLCEIAFRLTGVSLSHARIPLMLGLGGMVAGVFYLTASLTTLGFASLVTVIFFLFETRDLYLIAVNHRWDSGALAFLAVVAAFSAIRRGSRVLAAVAGACAAASAWITPTVGVIAIPLAVSMLLDRTARRLVAYLVAGGVLVTIICASVLAAQGALQPMIEHLLWTSANYSGPNHVPYGYAGTGFAAAAADLDPISKALFSIVLASVFVPAILPILAYSGWAFWFARNRKPDAPVLLLLGCSLALFASTYPRWDTSHMLYVTPVFYVLVATLAYRALSGSVLFPLFIVLSMLLTFLWVKPLLEAREFKTLQTPAGPVAVRPEDRVFLESILGRVHPGDSVFVFPNFPTIYFLTGGVNHSRFSFLQAGLMTDDDEQAALRELEAKPTRWVVYWDVPVERYLKTSPSADPARLRFHRIEQYLRTNYRAVETHNHWHGPYSILERL